MLRWIWSISECNLLRLGTRRNRPRMVDWLCGNVEGYEGLRVKELFVAYTLCQSKLRLRLLILLPFFFIKKKRKKEKEQIKKQTRKQIKKVKEKLIKKKERKKERKNMYQTLTLT